MGYSTIPLIEQIIAQSLTYSTPASIGTPVDLMKIGNVLDVNLVPSQTVEQFIQFADSEIDAQLSEMYVTPLQEFANFETTLYSDIDDYNDYIITTNRAPFYPGDNIILTDGENTERYVIESIVDDVTRNIFMTTTPILVAFKAIITRIIRVAYPNPIPLISARRAGANIYERYFASQSSPNESEYGKMMRKLAKNDIDNILNGRTILHAQKRIGNRFYNSNLDGRYSLPKTDTNETNTNDN
jgi:hypothetical protein